MKREYRITYKRVGLRAKERKFVRRASAERWMVLLGPEPWKALGNDPEALAAWMGGAP